MNLEQKIKIIKRNRIEDSRGWFLKVINGFEENLPQFTGEIYLTMATPNQTKGCHFHNKANEWFTLLEGNCLVKLFDLDTNERLEIILDADNPQTLYVPNNIAHCFINLNDNSNFLLLAYTDQLYDPADTIIFNDFDKPFSNDRILNK